MHLTGKNIWGNHFLAMNKYLRRAKNARSRLRKKFYKILLKENEFLYKSKEINVYILGKAVWKNTSISLLNMELRLTKIFGIS